MCLPHCSYTANAVDTGARSLALYIKLPCARTRKAIEIKWDELITCVQFYKIQT